MREKDAQIAIRIPEDLKKKLKKYADADQRSLSAFIRKILSDSCEKKDRDHIKSGPWPVDPGINAGA